MAGGGQEAVTAKMTAATGGWKRAADDRDKPHRHREDEADDGGRQALRDGRG